MSEAADIDATRAEREALELADDPVLKKMLEEERVESEDVDMTLLFKLMRYLRDHRAMSALAIVLSIVESLLMTMPAYIIGLAIDRAAGGEARTPQAFDAALNVFADDFAAMASTLDYRVAIVVYFGLVILAVWMLRWAVAVGTTYLVQRLGQYVVHDLRVDIYHHLTGMDQSYLHNNPVGRLVNRTTFDVQALSQLFSDAFAQGLRDLMFIIVLIVVMLTLDVPLALLLIGAFPLLIVIALVYRAFARPAMRTVTAVQSRMNSWLAENISGMRENQLYRRERRRRAEFRSLTDAHQAAVTRSIQAWGLLRPAMMIISAIATALVLWIGFERASTGIISVGILLTFLQYTTRLWRPVRNLTEKFNVIQTALTAGERIFDVLETPTQMTQTEHADPDLVVEEGRIDFDDVRFTYPGTEDEVLHGIDFHVEPGNILALIGDTGAGKSTIAHLISRFHDADSGEVRIDGRDVRDYTLEHLRRGIAIVPQDVVIFAGTIRDNITLGIDVPDDEVLSCAAAVCADELIERFEGGLDHVLEEAGRTLSSGERQLLSFARALVFNPPILLLDEATASVDTHTEILIQEALDELTRGRTTVVIAHRLSTIRDADQILVLRRGEIIERGRHDELLEQSGEYARLYHAHFAE